MCIYKHTNESKKIQKGKFLFKWQCVFSILSLSQLQRKTLKYNALYMIEKGQDLCRSCLLTLLQDHHLVKGVVPNIVAFKP